ncbi:histidine phosphotransferase ChpT [Tranquillimonas rosea]|uniref:Histidine phosphotransferase ChpT n=1 Tax=Tranquillimonas rosea TaxID=641238 RepID=A0A1H9VEZ9_9RHOB|nr:histidine phosphotransferase family protein [Tranquillimonas rosea]SES20275.1 histidine phosphotransferase ChpT [Tranquillimonas rosea]
MSDDLSHLVCARICHDLVSPLGAISNGVELLSLSNEGQSAPELDLISQCADEANARLLLYRVAFGLGSDTVMSDAEIHETLAPLTRHGRLTLQWEISAPVTRSELRLAALILMALEREMPHGGHVVVQAGEDGRWYITAQSPRLEIRSELWAGMTQHAEPPEACEAPSVVQFPLAGRVAASLGRTIDIRFEPERITITA